ncbi:hypothetical protein C7378_0502 [Acidipila rosea]|uniref:Uncharacterized protein n=1 Tax=Acidipila rosea TaxID=768535 RepID=A0A4R1LAP1_9BACT|nr:hypothetical protein C7378_0502 [Acidipila rosea]
MKLISLPAWAKRSGLVLGAILFAVVHASYAQNPVTSLSDPLIDETTLGSAPAPSAEITPGASDLTQPTRHLAPIDPLNSSLDATTQSPYINVDALSSTASAVAPYIQNALMSSFGNVNMPPRLNRMGVNPSLFDQKKELKGVSSDASSSEDMDLNSNGIGTESVRSGWSVGSVPVSQLAQDSLNPSVTGPSSQVLLSSGDEEIVNPGDVAVYSSQVYPQPDPGVPARLNVFTFNDSSPNSLLWSLASGYAASPFRDLASSNFLNPSIYVADKWPGLYASSPSRNAAGKADRRSSTAETRLRLDLTESVERPVRRRRGGYTSLKPQFHNPILRQMETNNASQY